MRAALECAHKGWGESVVIGVAAGGKEIATRPFQLVTGRGGEAPLGGYKSRGRAVLVVRNTRRENDVGRVRDASDGLQINEAFDLLHAGEVFASRFCQ